MLEKLIEAISAHAAAILALAGAINRDASLNSAKAYVPESEKAAPTDEQEPEPKPKPRGKGKAATASDPEPEPPAAADGEVTLEALRQKYGELCAAGKQAGIKPLLARYGVARISELPPAKFAAFADDLEALDMV